MSSKLLMVALVLASALLVGCSGGADEGEYKGETAKFKDADKPGAQPAAKKGGPGLTAEP